MSHRPKVMDHASGTAKLILGMLEGIRQATRPFRPDRHFGYLTKQYGLGLHSWIVDWCQRTERELAEGRVPR